MRGAERTCGPARFPLEIRAARTPQAAALVFRPGALPGRAAGSQALTFAELERWTGSIARSLCERGVARGERVGLLLPPGPAYPLLLLSVLRAGAVAVPVSTRLPGATIPDLLKGVGCRRLITGLDRRDSTGELEIVTSAPLLEASEDGRRDSANPLPPFERAADATIIFTSGTTGNPKAALHTFENHWSSAAGSNRNIPLRPGDRWLLSLPPWHVGGLAVIFRCLLGGAAVAIAGPSEPLADAIAGLGVTHLSLVATQLYRLLREERGRAALRGLKAVLLGGGPIPAALVAAAAREGVRLVTSYGSTEMSSQATATRPGDPTAALDTAGRRLAFRELAVAAHGEILVRGRTLFRGYVEGGGLRSPRDGAGWFHTGDLGHLDADGRLVVTGRRDTMFISGGENIHPEEIERAILRYPGMLEAIVAPAPDPEFGARPVAFLRTADGILPDAAALDRFLRLTVPGFMTPTHLLPWPDVGEGMKPGRRAFAAIAAALRAPPGRD
jgi:O-succinylbenzoic acid--CoA ligase